MPGQAIIEVNSGADGTTTGALSRAAFAAASSFARGESVDAAVQSANAALTPTTTQKVGGHPIILPRAALDVGDQVRMRL